MSNGTQPIERQFHQAIQYLSDRAEALQFAPAQRPAFPATHENSGLA